VRTLSRFSGLVLMLALVGFAVLRSLDNQKPMVARNAPMKALTEAEQGERR